MNILTINSGSTSIKFKLFDMPKEKVRSFGKVDNIGAKTSQLAYHKAGCDHQQDLQIVDHRQGLTLILDKMTSGTDRVIQDKREIDAIGHRVVHIGNKAKTTLEIDQAVIKSLEDALELAPLHNPPNLTGIKVCRKIFGPSTPNVAVFDNLFHRDIPPKAFLYGIPYSLSEKYDIRKYGFHGIAYTYMVKKASQLLQKEIKDLKIIALMLGGGSSAVAVQNGKTVDTSMGFTPAEGLIMSTRCGDMDPAIITYLMKKENLDAQKMDEMINKQSGLLGLSGKYAHFLEIEKGVEAQDAACIRAFDAYCYRIKKYIGAYTAAMNGVDTVIFGGGIGENSSLARAEILNGLDCLGITIDKKKNQTLSGEGLISGPKAGAPVAVVKVDEELVIARETYDLAHL